MSSSQQDQDGPGDNGQGAGQNQQPGGSLKEYITKDMVGTTLFSMRLFTIIGTLLFLISMFGLSPELGYRGYLNAMLTSFFTFTIRLYQRKQERQIYAFSKEMYFLFTTEDSGHYMLYTFFYYYQYPLSIYLIPPFLYAVLFTVKYTDGLIPFLPASVGNTFVQLNGRIASGQRELRRFIAYTEIFLMLVVIWNVIMGYMFFLAPLVHYNFVRLRYQSVRNNSVTLVFAELRLGAEFLSRHPRCPPFVSSLLVRAVTFISSLAPAQQMRRAA